MSEGESERPFWIELLQSALVPGLIFFAIWLILSTLLWVVGVYIADVNRMTVFSTAVMTGAIISLPIAGGIWVRYYEPTSRDD